MKKKTPKQAIELFENIIKASVKDIKPKAAKKTKPKQDKK